MKLVITETASVARILATFFNTHQKEFGYYKSDKYFVTWMDDCKIKLELLESLKNQNKANSHVPLDYKLTLVNKKEHKSSNPIALKKLDIIRQLTQKSKEVIIATMPSATAEASFRYLFEYLQIDLPFKRLWLESLCNQSITKAMLNIDRNKNDDTVFYAQKNKELIYKQLNQYYSKVALKSEDKLCFVNAVLLSLICQNYLDTNQSNPKTTYRIMVNLRSTSKDYYCYFPKLYHKENSALKDLKLIQKNSRVKTKSKNIEFVKEPAVLLFDFLTLTIKARSVYGFSSLKTLNILIRLYRQRFISYPLTLNKYLPQSSKDGISGVLNVLRDYPKFKETLLTLKLAKLHYRGIIKDENFHTHGILTTLNIPHSLTVDEKAIYELIAQRCIDTFRLQPQIRKAVLILDIENQPYDLLLEAFENNLSNNNSVNTVDSIDGLLQVDSFQVESAKIVKQTNQSESLFTFSSLIQKIQDDFIASLKQNGLSKESFYFFKDVFVKLVLGVDTLLEKGYVISTPKGLVTTEMGLDYYKRLTRFNLSSSSYKDLIDFELFFFNLKQGITIRQEFYRQSQDKLRFIHHKITYFTDLDNISDFVCLACKDKLELSFKRLVCLNKSCPWRVERFVSGVYLSEFDLEFLLKSKRSKSWFSFKDRKGYPFKAYLFFNEKLQLCYEFV
ncbi:DNA topoisomerase [Myroides sp. M-43]|uniref:type IA DNA topoisomerase n=1 Tax=Myroides oncorhynchi TaxID=2893756 RepID=UPI001E2A8AC2|nr:type IA DNA topoisomerase [Myroides oncorhynchi]MCC9043595.1 DNA topoisomerase [Myroides oncorhynchi]